MRAFFTMLLCGALLFTGAAAFAATDTRTIQNGPGITDWVGKPAAQVIQSLGQPTYTSHQDGKLIYDYVITPQHVGPVETYQFAIAGGKVDTTRIIF